MLEKNKVYTLREFCEVLKEGQEFKPKLGANVEKEDKKNNEKAVNDILKQVKEYDGGPKKNKKVSSDFPDYNNTTLDSRFAYDPGDEFKERVKDQVLGFASKENKKNADKDEKTDKSQYEGNKEWYDQRKKIADDRSERRQNIKHAGLKSHNLPKKAFEDNTMFKNESKNMKRLHFSKTVFLNEEEMMKKIPDDMKVNGNKFFMKDSVGNEYLVECVSDKVLKDVVHTNVVDYRNKEKLNETFKRMKELYGYKSQGNVQNSAEYENSMVSKMLSESKNRLVNLDNNKADSFFANLADTQK